MRCDISRTSSAASRRWASSAALSHCTSCRRSSSPSAEISYGAVRQNTCSSSITSSTSTSASSVSSAVSSASRNASLRSSARSASSGPEYFQSRSTLAGASTCGSSATFISASST
ncbi:MAG: hypothetical protein E7105_06890 [Prevotella sp.]|nr:hypothetical protein [Prevotella sp.]